MGQATEPAPNATMLARLVAAGYLADPEVAHWLQGAMAKYVTGEPLEKSLGLDRASRIRARNDALRDAARMLDEGRGPWPLAGRLEAALDRFEWRVWPRVKDQILPCGLGDLDAALFRVFAANLDRPIREQRGLYELLKGDFGTESKVAPIQ